MLVTAVRIMRGVAVCAAAALTVHLVLDVDESDIDDIDNMLVIQRIEHIFTISAAFDQTFAF